VTEFTEFPKIARLNRDVVISEKIDGTNAQILVEPVQIETGRGGNTPVGDEVAVVKLTREFPGVGSLWGNFPGVPAPETPPEPVQVELAFGVLAGSRSRWLQPGKQDNFGFAGWVAANAEALVALLGPGRHFGEWWGGGIQRKYGLGAKRFSLFNVSRYGEQTAYLDDRCSKVPFGSTVAEVLDPTARTVIEHKFHKGVKVCQCREARAAVDAEIGGVRVDSVPVLYRGPWFGTMYVLDPANRPTTYDVMMSDEKPAARQPRTGWAPALALQYLETEGSAAAPGFMKPEGICVFHEASGTLFKATIEGDEKPKGER